MSNWKLAPFVVAVLFTKLVLAITYVHLVASEQSKYIPAPFVATLF